MQKKISIFSFFSGIGILDLAFEKNGYNIVFVNEYDNLFIESYRYARMQMNLRAPIYGYRNDSAERYARRRGKKNLLALIAQEREKGIMFDKFRLKDVLAHYKQNFVSTQWGNEKYKWEAVKWFQDNWDVNAQNFPEMLSRSLDKTFNLLASINNFPRRMIVSFSKAAPEEVRAMFIALFDENKDVYERMNAFKLQASILLERYGNGAAQHYQYENAISTYLWLRYPDKYYIYKFGEVKNVANELETDYRFKKGAYADNIRNFLRLYNEISLAIKEDTELVNLFQSQLTDTCYPDPELKTLTIDVGFYISRFYSQQDENAEAATEWYGTDYNPGLTIEDWKKLLKDGTIFTTSALEIMRRIKDYGGQASCTQLAVKYGETKNFYNSGSVALAHRVCEAAGIKPATREDGSTQWWTVLYTGRDADKGEDGSFIWKLRDELSEALDQTDLSVRTNGCTPSLIMTFCQCLVSTGLMIQVNSDVGKIFCRVCFNDQR